MPQLQWPLHPTASPKPPNPEEVWRCLRWGQKANLGHACLPEAPVKDNFLKTTRKKKKIRCEIQTPSWTTSPVPPISKVYAGKCYLMQFSRPPADWATMASRYLWSTEHCLKASASVQPGVQIWQATPAASIQGWHACQEAAAVLVCHHLNKREK